MWSLGERDLFAVVNTFQDKPLLHLRHQFEDKGQWMPSRKGITLTLAEWTVLKNHLEDIDRSFQREFTNLHNERKSQSDSRETRPGSYRLHSILFSEEDRQFRTRLSRIIQTVRRRDDYQKVWQARAVLDLPAYQRLVREHYATPSPIDIVVLLVYTQDLFASVGWYQAELIRYTYLKTKHLSQFMLAHCASNCSPPSCGIVRAVSLTARRSWTTISVACWNQRNSWGPITIGLG